MTSKCKKVLSLDQSVNSTGVVVFDVTDTNKLRIGSQKVFTPKSTGIYRMYRVFEWLQKTFDDVKPDLVVRERHNQRQFGAASALQSIGTLVDIVAFQSGLTLESRYAIITSGTWKKFCVGKGNLKKDTAYLIHINKFIRGSNHLSVPEGYIVLDDNIADAICLAVTAYVARRIKFDLPAGVTSAEKYDNLKKNLDGIFDYGKKAK